MRRPPRPYYRPQTLSELERPRPRPGSAIRSGEARARVTFSLIWGVVSRFGLIAAVIFLAWQARVVIVTVFVAVLLAVTLYPIVNALSRPPVPWVSRRARRTAYAFILFVLLGVALYFSYRLLVHPFLDDAQDMFHSLQQQAGTVEDMIASGQAWLRSLPPGFQGPVRELEKALGNLRLDAIAGRIPLYLTRFFQTSAEWLAFIVNLVLIPVLSFYLIVEWRGLKRELLGLVPVRWRRNALVISRSAGRILRDYTLANLVLCLIAGVAVYVGLSLLSVPYALSLAVLAGITRFVPIVGPLISAVPIVLLSLSQGFSVAVGVLVFITLLHLVESKLLLPRLIGNRLHIHGALVLIVLLLGGEFAGIIGMFLAAPVAALVRVILRLYVLRVRRKPPPVPRRASRVDLPPHPVTIIREGASGDSATREAI